MGSIGSWFSRGFDRLAARPRLAVVVIGLGLLLSGNGVLPLLDRDEPRFAEAGREMLQTGDWAVPWCNGVYRFDKPPLIYWCEVACYRVLGVNEFAARMPAALFSVGTALVLVAWGRRLGRVRAGLAAGLMFLTCVQVQIHGRLAVADLPMVFFVTLAVWCGWEWLRSGGKGGGWWAGCFGAMGFGFLAKGPEAWLPLAGLGWLAWRRGNDFRFHAGWMWAGVGVMLGLTLAWAVPALVQTHGEYYTVGLLHHVVYRSVGDIDGHGGGGWLAYAALLPLYLATFFFSFFPWSWRLAGRLRGWWTRERETDVLGVWLLTQAGLFFLVFSLVRTKLPHYTLPAFPLLALWLGLRVEGEPDFGRWFGRRLAGMAVFVLLLTWVGFGLVRPWFVAEEIWDRVADRMRPETRVASVGYGEISLVWKLRSVMTNNVVLSSDPNGLAAFFAAPGPWIFLAPTNYTVANPAWTNGAVAVRISGGDVSRWHVEPREWELMGRRMPGWVFVPRHWELNAWVGNGPMLGRAALP